MNLFRIPLLIIHMCLGFYRWAKNMLGWIINISREQSKLLWHHQKCIIRWWCSTDSGWVFRKHYDITQCRQWCYLQGYTNALPRLLLGQSPPNAQSLFQRASKSRNRCDENGKCHGRYFSSCPKCHKSLEKKLPETFLVCTSGLLCNLLILPFKRIWWGTGNQEENTLHLSAHQYL